MGRLIYLAYPIDGVTSTAASMLQSDVTAVRNYITSQKGMSMYDPGRAFNCYQDEPDPRVQAVNHAALMRADAVVALYPLAASSVGVPMEMAFAVAQRIPVHVWREAPSWALQVPGVTQHFQITTLLPAIRDITELDRSIPTRPQLRWVDESEGASVHGEPRLGYPDDAGFDLTYVGGRDLIVRPDGLSVNVPCGMRFEMPPNTWGLILGRSSTFHARGLLVNTAVIDPGYRGPMFVSVRCLKEHSVHIAPGERLAQMIPLPVLASRMDVVQVEQLSETDRGDKGFGSTGK